MDDEVPVWNGTTIVPRITGDEVNIWRVVLPEVLTDISMFETTLSSMEISRANKFHFKRDRQRFVIGRAILRILLGQYLAMVPHDIKFEYGVYGKPRLRLDQNSAELEFNLTHSNNIILCAFVIGKQVGIDVEKIQPISNLMSCIETCFSPYEKAELQALPPTERQKMFYAYWTCKESYTKALGQGLSLPLIQFSMSLGLNSEVQLLNVDWDTSERQRWLIRQLSPAAEYAAAITIEGTCPVISYWHYPLNT